MPTDKNKLAWKGTPGPWYFHGHRFSLKDYVFKVHQYPEGVYGNPIICSLAYGEDGKPSDEVLANGYMASVAPEAVEFIADFLQFADEVNKTLNLEDLYFVPKDLITRSEEILKKAYNF